MKEESPSLYTLFSAFTPPWALSSLALSLCEMFKLCCRKSVLNVQWLVRRVLKDGVKFSPNIIISGWLGSRLTNWLTNQPTNQPSRESPRCSHPPFPTLTSLYSQLFHVPYLDTWALPWLSLLERVQQCCTKLFHTFSPDQLNGSVTQLNRKTRSDHC